MPVSRHALNAWKRLKWPGYQASPWPGVLGIASQRIPLHELDYRTTQRRFTRTLRLPRANGFVLREKRSQNFSSQYSVYGVLAPSSSPDAAPCPACRVQVQ